MLALFGQCDPVFHTFADDVVHAGRRHGEDQLVDEFGMLRGEELGDHAALRYTQHGRFFDSERTQGRRLVRGHVADRDALRQRLTAAEHPNGIRLKEEPVGRREQQGFPLYACQTVRKAGEDDQVFAAASEMHTVHPRAVERRALFLCIPQHCLLAFLLVRA